MELIEIVDNRGNFTGQIIEKEEAHDKNLLHNEISVFIINNKKTNIITEKSCY